MSFRFRPLLAAAFMGAALALAQPVWAEGPSAPSVEQVFQAARAGHLQDAQRMMDQVLAKHPDSAKAHYVEARLLAAQGRWANAGAQFREAERLAPGLPFLKAQELAAFKAQLVRHGAGAGAGRSRHGWASLLVGAIFAAFLIWLVVTMIRRSQARRPLPPSANNPYGTPGMGPMGPGYGPGGPGMATGGIGGGLMGGLATGLGVGAGLAAGEALAGSLFDHKPAGGQGADGADASQSLGGNDFGLDGNDWGNGTDLAGGDSDFGVGDDNSWT